MQIPWELANLHSLENHSSGVTHLENSWEIKLQAQNRLTKFVSQHYVYFCWQSKLQLLGWLGNLMLVLLEQT